MSIIEEPNAVGNNNAASELQVKQKELADRGIILHEVAKKYGLDVNILMDSGLSTETIGSIIRAEIKGNNGSTEFNGEKKQTLYAKMGYNIDGLAVNVATHISEAKGQGSGGSDNDSSSSSGGDFVEKAKLFSANVDPLNLAFPDFSTRQKVGGIANAYQKAGVEMMKDGEATDALKTLISIADEIDRDEVLDQIRKNK